MPALAQEATAPTVRVALSAAANKRLREARVRRLLAIELEAAIDPKSTGPLGDDVIRVWIAAPNPRRVVIEVRRNGRPLARRALTVGAFPSDVAARVVVIAASEMVRVQARAPRPDKPDKRPITPPDSDSLDFLRTSAGLATSWLPTSAPAWLIGSELSVEHRRGMVSQTLFGRWMFGEDGLRARWFELGAGIDMRIPIKDEEPTEGAPAIAWRFRLGLRGAAAAVWLPEATTVDGATRTVAATARGAALFGIEGRLSPRTWIGLAFEPGAALTTANIVSPGGRSELGGFLLSTSLYFLVDGAGAASRATKPE